MIPHAAKAAGFLADFYEKFKLVVPNAAFKIFDKIVLNPNVVLRQLELQILERILKAFSFRRRKTALDIADAKQRASISFRCDFS